MPETTTECTCGSIIEDDEGNIIHYSECDIILERLGYFD